MIAPDLPGFGQTKAPPRGAFDCTFDHLADVIEGFTEALSLDEYALYVFDYGAPVGFRLAMRHPERVSAIVSQNGNAYVEGFSGEWGPWEAYWREPSAANRPAVLRSRPTRSGTGSMEREPIRAFCLPMAMSWTSPLWHDRVPRKSSST